MLVRAASGGVQAERIREREALAFLDIPDNNFIARALSITAIWRDKLRKHFEYLVLVGVVFFMLLVNFRQVSLPDLFSETFENIVQAAHVVVMRMRQQYLGNVWHAVELLFEVGEVRRQILDE